MNDRQPGKATGRDSTAPAVGTGGTRQRTPAESDATAWVYPFHPFLLAAASVLALYASNVKQASLLEILPALGSALGCALLVVLAVGGLCRGFSARAAVLASVILLGCLFYARLFFWVDLEVGGGGRADLFLFLLVLAVVVVVVARTRIDLRLPHSILNGIGLILLVTPIAQVTWYHWQNARPALAATVADEAAALAGERPDIYYLIFDRYASPSTLQRYFDFNDAPLIAFLEKNGFYVAPGSHANYLKTGHSLASTLQMDYLDFLADREGRRSSDWAPIYRMLREHRVARFLKSSGYRYVQIGSWWSPTQVNPYADANPRFGFREFTSTYAQGLALRPLLNLVAPDSPYTRSLQWDYGQCQRVPWQIEQIKQAAVGSEATFVFAHILVPHEPFVFDGEGRCLSAEESRKRGTRQGYVEQIRYANKIIMDLVTTLQARKGKQPIIIVQGDEGPFPETDVGNLRSWREADHDELQIKMGIMNAYYFPDGDYRQIYPSITPVNSFRVLFNKYFQADFNMLPDRIYGFPDTLSIYEFFDITNKVRDYVD
ncbi:MAG: sulfatase-like hydrolase/transferase [Geminicoccaceae bacterium]